MKHTLLATSGILLTPFFVHAQTPGNFKELVGIFLNIISILVLVVFALTLLVFLWGVARGWIFGAGDPGNVEKGRQTALWGIIGLVVMAGLWGIIALIKGGIFGF